MASDISEKLHTKIALKQKAYLKEIEIIQDHTSQINGGKEKIRQCQNQIIGGIRKKKDDAYTKAHDELKKMVNKCIIIDNHQVLDLASPVPAKLSRNIEEDEEMPTSPNPSVEVLEEQISLKNENQLKNEIKIIEPGLVDDNNFEGVPDNDLQETEGQDGYYIEGKSPKITSITLNSFFKTKGSILLQIKPNQVENIERKIGECPVNFLSKCVATSDEECYLIGGASDIKQSKVFPFVFKSTSSGSLDRKANMHQARAAFACCLNKEYGQIFVVGGSINQQESTNRSEFYSIKKDEWTELPNYEEGLCSSSVISTGRRGKIGPKWLFSFGGITKSDGQLNIVSYIYRLDLDTKDQWIRLPVNLSNPLCDIGLTVVSEPHVENTKILIYGGWNYTSYSTLLKLSNHNNLDQITIEQVQDDDGEKTHLPRGDFYIVNGCEIDSQILTHIKLIRGHLDTLQLNKITLQFEYLKSRSPTKDNKGSPQATNQPQRTEKDKPEKPSSPKVDDAIERNQSTSSATSSPKIQKGGKDEPEKEQQEYLVEKSSLVETEKEQIDSSNTVIQINY